MGTGRQHEHRCRWLLCTRRTCAWRRISSSAPRRKPRVVCRTHTPRTACWQPWLFLSPPMVRTWVVWTRKTCSVASATQQGMLASATHEGMLARVPQKRYGNQVRLSKVCSPLPLLRYYTQCLGDCSVCSSANVTSPDCHGTRVCLRARLCVAHGLAHRPGPHMYTRCWSEEGRVGRGRDLQAVCVKKSPAWRHSRRGNGVKVVFRGAATLGGAGGAHVSAHGAIECSVLGNFLASDCTEARKTMIRQFPTI